MTRDLVKLKAKGLEFYLDDGFGHQKVDARAVGRPITIKKNRYDRELKRRIIQRAPNANAYTISPMATTAGSNEVVYAVQYFII